MLYLRLGSTLGLLVLFSLGYAQNIIPSPYIIIGLLLSGILGVSLLLQKKDPSQMPVAALDAASSAVFSDVSTTVTHAT